MSLPGDIPMEWWSAANLATPKPNPVQLPISERLGIKREGGIDEGTGSLSESDEGPSRKRARGEEWAEFFIEFIDESNVTLFRGFNYNTCSLYYWVWLPVLTASCLDNSTDFQSSYQKLSKESRQELCRRHADLYSAAYILPHQPMFEMHPRYSIAIRHSASVLQFQADDMT